MEAVPRLPMLSFDLKHSPEYVEFAPVLKQHIRDHYGEDPANYNKACNDLEQLRQSAVHVSHDFMGCSTLKKYYAQLQFLLSRFPVGEGGEAAIPFTWEEVHTAREVTLADAKFEQACVLYNIGSLHSILGAMDTRQTADGMKVSCTHFQCAAWAYEYLRDHFGCSSMSMDMAHELLTFQVTIALAQAQECILEKSMIDSRKSTITAKVSAQTVDYYTAALKHLETCEKEGLIGSRKYKDWKRRTEIKIAFYQCVTSFYQGHQSEAQQKWGECVAFYTLSHDKLMECTKMAKNEISEIQEALKFTNDVVGGKLQAMKKDNDFVYHDKVPAADTLSDVKGASLVKGIPFNPSDQEISGQDIFHKLVPMEAHEAASLYSEEKAKLIRKISASVEEKNDELSQYMSSSQLDPSKLSHGPEKLPQELLEKCAAVSVRPNAVKDLVESMGAVSNVAIEVEMGIKEIQSLLDNEQEKEEEFQKLFGKRTMNVVLSEIRKECDMYLEGHEKGSQSNNDLHKAMNTHITNLRLLGGPLEAIQKALPSLENEKNLEDETIVNELRRLLSKVDEMRKQRADVEAEFRASIHSDDITNVIVTREGTNKEVLFEEQLGKHNKQIEILERNLAAQDNILRALTDTNAKYANIRRKTNDTIARREAMVRDLMNSYDVYEDLLAKSQKGQEFYRKLETNVSRLVERTRRVCKTQQDERDQIMNRFKPKEPSPARPLAPKPSTGLTDALPPPGLTSFEGPKLKDYLPFMKPATFGPKTGQALPPRSGSLPGSSNVSPIHVPHGSVSQPGTPQHGQSEIPNQQQYGLTVHPQSSQPQLHIHPHSPQPQQYAPPHSPQPQQYALPHSPQPQIPQSQSLQPQNMQTYTGQLHSPCLPPQGSQPQFSHQISQSQTMIPPNLHSQVSQPQQYIPPSHGTTSNQYPSPVQSPMPQKYPSQPCSPMPQNDLGQLQSSKIHQIQKPNQQAGHSQVTVSPQPPVSQSIVLPQHSISPQPPVSQSFSPQHSISPQLPGSQNVFSSQYSTSFGTPQNYIPSSQGQVPQQTMQSQSLLQKYTGEQFSQQHMTSQDPSQQLQGTSQHLSLGPSAFQPVGINSAICPDTGQVVPSSSVQGKYDVTNTVSAITTPIISPTRGQCQQEPGHSQQQYVPQLVHPNLYVPNVVSSGSQVYNSQLSGQQNLVQSQKFFQPEMRMGQVTSGQGFGSMGQTSMSSQVVYSQASLSTMSGQSQSASQGTYLQQPQISNQPQPLQSQLPMVSQQQQIFQQSNMGMVQPPEQPLPGQLKSQQQLANPSLGVTEQQQQMGHGVFQPQQWPRQQLPPQQQLPQQMQTQIANQQQVFQRPQVPQQQPTGQQFPVRAQQQLPRQQVSGQQYTAQQQQLSGQHLNSQPLQTPPNPQQQLVGQQLPGQQLSQQPSFPGYQQYPGQAGPHPNQSAIPGQSFMPPQGSQSNVQPGLSQTLPIQNQPATSYNQSAITQQMFPGQPCTSAGSQIVLPQTATYPPQTSQGQSGQIQTTQPGQGVQPLPHHMQPQAQSLQGLRQTIPNQPLPGTQTQQQAVSQLSQLQQVSGQHAQQQPLPGQANVSQQWSGQPSEHTRLPGQQQTQQRVIQQHWSSQSSQLPGQQPSVLPQQLGQQQWIGQTIAPNQPMGQQQTQLPSQQQTQLPSQQQTQLPSQQQTQLPSQQQTQLPSQQQTQLPSQQQTQLPSQQQTQLPSQQQTQLPSQQWGQTGEPNLPPPLQPEPAPQMSTKKIDAKTIGPMADIRQSTTMPSKHPVSIQSVADQTTANSTISHSTVTRQLSSTSTASLDDILSTFKDEVEETPPDGVLTPKVLTAQEIQQQKEEALKNSRHVVRDPYNDKHVLDKFVVEVEKLSKFIETLCKPTCSGPSQLDTIWKELMEEQERWGRKHSMAIARCCAMKNRDQDIMPYDDTRVILASHKDDYINASWVNDLSPSCPKFIVAQSPLPVTMTDFWLMVYEQGVEVLVMLSSEQEMGKKLPVYWLEEKGQTVDHGPVVLTLQSVKVKQFWTERIIHLRHCEAKQARTIVHLLYNTWPISGYPDKIAHLLQFIAEVHSFYRQQRSLLKPVLVYCSSGIGRTGTFALIYTGMQEINHGHGIISIPEVAVNMLHKQRNLVRDKDQLKYCYDAIFYYAQDILAKQGILIHKEFGDKLPGPAEKQLQWTPTQDIVFGSVSLHTLQSSISKLGLKSKEQQKQRQSVATETKNDSTQIQTDDKILGILEDSTVCSLPDVVQRTGITSKNVETSQSSSDMDMLSGIDSPAEVLSRSNSSISNKSVGTGSGLTSLEASPRHKAGQENVDKLPMSLADLQNPNTFTLGSEEKMKQKITKASFSSNTSSINDTLNDPKDPFSTLDPLWKEKK